MPGPDVVVIGAGVVTAVGVTLPEAAAAVRAHTMRFTESPFRDRQREPVIMATVLEDALPPLDPAIEPHAGVSSRERRMLRLASQALTQCMRAIPKTATNVPISIALPNIDGVVGLDRKAFIQRLAIQSGAPIAVATSVAHHNGRAGGLLALSDAREMLHRGVARYVIAGGVDSYRDANAIASLDARGRIKSSANLDAFIPGEAAALLVMTTAFQARQDGLTPLATCSAAASAFEEGHLLSSEPYRAEALATAVGALAAAGEVAGPVTEVFSSMNGEHHWGREWSVAFLRHRGLFDAEHGFHHPADSYGDIGAATGPMLVALAAFGQHMHYRRSPALVYCSSDDGPRAAMFVHQGA